MKELKANIFQDTRIQLDDKTLLIPAKNDDKNGELQLVTVPKKTGWRFSMMTSIVAEPSQK